MARPHRQLTKSFMLGVPDAIATLSRAGMKVWVLTGDKVETAINIGLSCNLISVDMELMRIEVDSQSDVDKELDLCTKTIENLGEAVPAMIVDGRSLGFILEHKHRSRLFFEICRHCTAVIACRVSPRQKASVIKMVKQFVRPEPMTLAIGDGANDVSMIQVIFRAHNQFLISSLEGELTSTGCIPGGTHWHRDFGQRRDASCALK